MKQKFYSYTLVVIQFSLITILLIINGSIFSHLLSFVIFFLGLTVGIYALFHNGLGNFNIIPEIKEEATLATKGVYKYIRHPMYFSVVFMMLAVIIFNLNKLNIFIYAMLIFILYLKAKKEEILWSKKSPEYKAYMQKTKRIIPFIL
ncbi:MAG: isoprenylcysteine carboxylmethyltransferase family protein [Campylobacteraceae bacterium]|nr:isoprenylcysteine carboxylmethyltransferase family protein [Campylobacteraceae bacterium]